MKRPRSVVRAIALTAAVPALALGTASGAWATPGEPQPVPDGLASQYEIPEPSGLAPDLADATGRVDVAVTLSEPSIGDLLPQDALKNGTIPSAAQQKTQRNKVKGQQDKFVREARGTGATEIARTQLVSNIVLMSVDAEELVELAELTNVLSVKGIGRYEKHEPATSEEPVSGSLAQALDYLEVTPVHEAGIDGTGVRVAVLDSGIDYTHVNLGGPGDMRVVEECFAQASQAPTGICAELFGPDAPKVKGGYDFVGDAWPGTTTLPQPLIPDPNPIDSGPEGGHGTSVADIIAGRSQDGTHKGIAPGADLYAVKVCSSVSTSCSGVAMLQGLEWALDPNGDGDVSDAVDIVNMSLGSSYGQEQDDSVLATNNLVNAGVVVVASAGNSADRPFILGSPSSADGAISVAQTALPDDLQWVVETSNGMTINNAVHQSWSPLPTGLMSAPLATPNDPNNYGCDAPPATIVDHAQYWTEFPAGSIALIQRGNCNVSDKAVLAQNAGAIAVIIYNNAPGDPPSFSFASDEEVRIPTFTISQADGRALVAAMAGGEVIATLDPAAAVSLANTIVGTSSRGPSTGTYLSKPDIGAPGAWLAADTQTGTEMSNFGGTSGAAPVVSGVAALVLDAHHDATPLEVKARLLNGADYGNRTPAAAGWYGTPISRVGAGEVRAYPSVFNDGWLTVPGYGGNVGLGIPSITTTKQRFQVQLVLSNTSDTAKTYDLEAVFRDKADQASGAVKWQLSPSSVRIPAGKTKTVRVSVFIDGSKLKSWPFNEVGSAGDGAALNAPEYDGYILATSGEEELHIGWTVLPKKAADVSVQGKPKLKRGTADIRLRNASRVEDGVSEVYSLTGTSPELPNGGPGEQGSNEVIIDLAAVGVYADSGVVQFAIANYDRWTNLNYPVQYNVFVDTDNDGTDDYVVYNAEVGAFASSGQSVVYVVDLETEAGGAYYYTGGGFDSSIMVLTAPASALGLAEGDTFTYDVYAFDNYFTGNATDAIEDMAFTYGQPAYVVEDFIEVPKNGRATLRVTANPDAGESTQTGLLLRHLSAATDDWEIVTLNR